MTTAWTSGLHNWQASHILVGIKTFIFLSPSDMTKDYTCFFQVLLQNVLCLWMLFQQQRAYCRRARGSGFLPWGPDSEAADCCCQQQNSFKAYPPPFRAQAVHSHLLLNLTSTTLSLPHHFCKARGSPGQSGLTGEVQDGCIWAGPQRCPLVSSIGVPCSAHFSLSLAVAGERFHAGLGHRVWFPLFHRCDCIYTRSFGRIENVYHIPSSHCWSRKCLKYISGLAPHNTRAMVVCSTPRYACPLLIQNCSTLSVHVTAQPLWGTLCLLLHSHTSQRFAFWSVNGVSRIGCYAGTLQRG